MRASEGPERRSFSHGRRASDVKFRLYAQLAAYVLLASMFIFTINKVVTNENRQREGVNQVLVRDCQQLNDLRSALRAILEQSLAFQRRYPKRPPPTQAQIQSAVRSEEALIVARSCSYSAIHRADPLRKN